MRRAYLKRYSGPYIKGSASKRTGGGTGWAMHQARVESAEIYGRGEYQATMKDGTKFEVWVRGANPRHVVENNLVTQAADAKLLEQTPRHQKRKHYNKVVLKSTQESVVTMYFSGADVFLIEDYPDGTFRQSLQSSSTTFMKQLYENGRVRWL